MADADVAGCSKSNVPRQLDHIGPRGMLTDAINRAVLGCIVHYDRDKLRPGTEPIASACERIERASNALASTECDRYDADLGHAPATLVRFSASDLSKRPRLVPTSRVSLKTCG